MMKLMAWSERLLALMLFLALVALAWAAQQWRTVSRAGSDLHALASGNDIAPDRLAGAIPEVRLARAVYLARAGREDDALDLLDYLASHGEERVRVLALYDLGNLRLRQALAKLEGGSTEQAMPLVEMAKFSYRQALVLDPAFWDGKYNLELAMRLLPEMDRVSNGEDDLPPEAQKKIWTGVPGFPRGLP